MDYTVGELQEKLDKLREKYKTSVGMNKKIIEIRGKLLKIALEKMMEKQQRII